MLAALCALGASARWVGTWATAPQPCSDNDLPPVALTGNSLRQTIKVSLGGERMRLTLTNEYGDSAVDIRSVYVAPALGGPAIDGSSARYLQFGGRRSVTIPAGQRAVSDALDFDLQPLELLSVTINYGAAPSRPSEHSGSRTTSYIVAGPTEPSAGFEGAAEVVHWYNLCSVDVESETGEAIAILGNSITDGRGSTTDAQNRWPDMMAQALGGNVGVLNLGIGGNFVVRGGIGPTGISRFPTDILGQQGVTTVIVFEGINDIGGECMGAETPAKLIEAYRSFIDAARGRGMRIYGATITAIRHTFYDSPQREAMRQTVNKWIRTSGEFDGVIDFDALLCNPEEADAIPARLLFDELHPNAEAYRLMGEYAAGFVQRCRR